MMPNRISILGSTGSIGVQTLEAARGLAHVKVSALAAHSNVRLLCEQIEEFKPDVAAMADEMAANELKKIYNGNTRILSGPEGVIEAAVHSNSDTVLNAVVGSAGLLPTLAAIDAGKDIALANKEALVAAGELVTARARLNGVSIIPVDSEHSAIFQCLQGNDLSRVNKIYLTASGGPFKDFDKKRLTQVKASDALRHPTWRMGRKITIDCATLMNKGLEVIEAARLFNLPPERIVVLVHPQSVIHSMVEFIDGTVMAQLGAPDMRVPIQYALTWPDRAYNKFNRLDFTQTGPLTFEQPDTDAFPCLALAYRALETGGTLPAVMNMANEVAVRLFLDDKIKFTDIPVMIEDAMDAHDVCEVRGVEDVLAAEDWAREHMKGLSKWQ